MPRQLAGLLADRRLTGIASAILGSNVITSALGVVFWMLSAQGLAPASVGQLGAATAAMGLIGSLGAMGLGPLLISELPGARPDEQRSLFTVGVLSALVLGALLGGGFGAAAGAWQGAWEPIAAPGAGWWWFAAGCALTGLSMVFDQAMLVVGNPRTQVWRNLVASVWKLVALALAMVVSMADVTVALAAWVSGLAVGAVLALVAGARRLPGDGLPSMSRLRATVSTFWRASLAHCGINYALTVTGMAMPPLIAFLVTPEDNALYTTARLATMLGFMIPYAVSISVFARAAGNTDVDHDYLGKVFWLSLGLSLIMCIGVVIVAPLVLWFFGSTYVESGTIVLRVMSLAGPLLVFKDQFIARRRIERRLDSLLAYVIAGGIAEVAFMVVGAGAYGLLGALVGWLIAMTFEALYAALFLFRRPNGAVEPARQDDLPQDDLTHDDLTQDVRSQVERLQDDRPIEGRPVEGRPGEVEPVARRG